MKPKPCTECGTVFTRRTLADDFCQTSCRKAFNNRRAVRGAELYDLFMCVRFDRPVATTFKAWRLMCRMASGFRDEDLVQRDGRKSWRHPRRIVDRRPYLQTIVMSSNIAGMRR